MREQAGSIRAGDVRATSPRTARPAARGGYTELLDEVRAAGLLAKRPGYYGMLFAIEVVLLAAALIALVTLGPSPLQLLVAAALGVVLAQLGFLAHEAAHRQIFASGRRNDLVAQLLGPALVGLSFTWWVHDHNAHHGNPNVVGRDPSATPGAFVFRPEDAAGRRGFAGAFARVQGFALFPLLLLEGVNLHVRSLVTLLRRRRSGLEQVELVLLVARLVLLPWLVLAVLPLWPALGFLGTQLAVFGLYLGGSFVPNHVGMPILPAGQRLDYLSKQVRTSRNLRGGRLMSLATGGLSLQIEHHLFPGMARPNLLRVRPLVQAHCARNGLPYTELPLLAAYGAVVTHLNRVGLAAGTAIRCPIAEQCGRR
jgi:fatty acid desaturase